MARDRALDGRFVYAVRTTGIYCRPSCSARRPLRHNVAFYATAGDAEADGFRACLRCGPSAVPGAGRAVERARAHLDATTDRTVPLRELADVAGMSAWHLQRTFRQAVGMTPRQYAAARRVARLKSRLRQGDTVSTATFDAGFGAASRAYDAADAHLGMTPAAYRRGGRGVRIRYALTGSPLGRLLVAATDRGVCAVTLGDADEPLVAALRAEYPEATLAGDDPELAGWSAAIVAELAGRARADVPLDVRATAFQRQVWQALREIPAGRTESYAGLAHALGRPTAARAVARACASNPVAVVVPCHRVVRGDGGLGGYRWGVERKRELLARERAADDVAEQPGASSPE